MTFVDTLLLKMVHRSFYGLLYDSSHLELDCKRVPGQQQSVKYIQELHCQQLEKKVTLIETSARKQILQSCQSQAFVVAFRISTGQPNQFKA